MHEVFGKVKFDPEDELNEWESEAPWAGGTVGLDITFDGATMDQATLDRLARYLTDLAAFDEKARVAMRANLTDENSAVQDYIEHHRDEKDLLRRVFGTEDASTAGTDAFLAALRLVRVGLYTGTDESEYEAVFDYTIDPENVQYLVVVNFGDDGAVDEICMES
jgi:hypothetical protein